MFSPLMGSPIPLCWKRPHRLMKESLFSFVGEVYLSFCGGVLCIILWCRPLYLFFVNNLSIFRCLLVFARNMTHFILDMFSVILLNAIL